MSSDFFISLYLQAFIKNLVQIGTVVSEKIWFEFLYVHDLGPRSRNDLDLQYSHIFIYSIRCLLLLTFRSLAAIVFEKFTVFTFSYRSFLQGFTIDGRGGHLGHVTQMPRTNFRYPYPRRLHIKFGFDRASDFGEEDV